MTKTMYCCYSADLKEYIASRGLRYEICGLAPNEPHQMFWAYKRCKELNEILDSWREAKSK